MAKVAELFGAREIASCIERLADRIAEAYPETREQPVVVIVLLKGAFMFAADLVRALDRRGVHPEVDFLTASSYGTGTESSGVVQVRSTPSCELANRDVLLVDDILDTGRSLKRISAELEALGAVSIRTCVLLDKPSRRVEEVEADFVGFVIPDRFVVGYGVDLAERYRHLPFVGVLEEG